MKKRESMMEPEDKSDDLIIRLGTPADLDEVMKAAVEAIAEIGLVEPDPERHRLRKVESIGNPESVGLHRAIECGTEAVH